MSELDTLEAELKRRSDPVVTVPELADDLEPSDTRIRQMLESLELVGKVGRKDVGARATAWWHEERVVGPDATPDGRDTGHGTRRDPPTADDAVSAVSGDGESDGLTGVGFPATRDRAECVEAVEAAREYIREHGGATMRELVGAVMPQYPVGYEVPELAEGDRYRGAWWRKVVKPGLEADSDVSKPPTGGSRWTWDGER